MKKRLVVLMLALTMMLGSTSFATTQDFGFWFRGVNEKNRSEPAKKDDSETLAYVTGSDFVLDPTTGSIYVGYRVRNDAGIAATNYRVFAVHTGGATSAGVRHTLTYNAGMAIAGKWYTLNGQYDDASSDTTNSWSVHGRWTP